MGRSVVNPFCGSVYDEVRWDFSECYSNTVLVIVPAILLFVLGGLAFPSLYRRYKAGERPEKGGKAAYKLKIVRLLAQFVDGFCVGRRGRAADKFVAGNGQFARRCPGCIHHLCCDRCETSTQRQQVLVRMALPRYPGQPSCVPRTAVAL